MCKVSVIMGIYNCAATLQEALDSLYAQTFQDFEIILCDDGSKDDTYEIALANQRCHKNIVLLRNERNLGLNKTLNNCLAVAKGEYIARMDGDDISLPTRFEREVDFLDSHPEFAIVSTPMIYFDENGEFRRGSVRNHYPNKYDFISGTPFCHAPCMVRVEAYNRVGGYSEDERLLRVEDYNLWFKMYAAGYRGHILDEHLYKMRDDNNAHRRRTWKNRCNEVYCKYTGYRMIGIPWYYWICAIKSIAVYLLPSGIYKYLHRCKS